MAQDHPESEQDWGLPRGEEAIGNAIRALGADIADRTAQFQSASQEWRESHEGVETWKWITELTERWNVLDHTPLTPSWVLG